MSPPKQITEAEWEIMNVVWERPSIPAAAIAETLADKRGWTLATVRTLLRRLANKSLVKQEKDGKRYLYAAAVSREACVRQASRSLLSRLFGRQPANMILHLVRETDLSPSEIEELRKILHEKEQ